MELKRLKQLVNESKEDGPQFAVLDLIMGGSDHDLVFMLAKAMKDADFSTTQRNDGWEIVTKKKMDKQQIMYRLDNLGEFLKICQKELVRIKKDVKEEIKDLVGN